MVHAFVSLLAAAEEEKSKTPFYIVGCLFGLWAIVLFAIGQRSETFPSTPAVARALGGVSVVLCASAAALAVYVG